MIRSVKIKITKEGVLRKARKLAQKKAELAFRQQEIKFLKEKVEKRETSRADKFLESELNNI